MSYLLKSKPKKGNWNKTISVLALLLFLLLLGFFSASTRNIFYKIARPIWTAANAATSPFPKIKNFFVSRQNLINKNIVLEDELGALRLKEIDYDVLSKENQELKDQAGRRTDRRLILSRVLSKPPRSPYDTFVIDIGSEEGVIKGSKVYLSDNVIVGLVTSLTPTTSLVELFSAGDQKQEAILSRTGASFTLNGKGGANFEIEVPKDTDIMWGDVFLYPGLASSVIGSVYYIDSNSQSSFKTIYLRIPGNVFQTKTVFVE